MMLKHMHNGKHLSLEFFNRYNDEDFFAYTVPRLSTVHFESKDMVFLRNAYADCVYFVINGTVAFFNADDQEMDDHFGSGRKLMDNPHPIQGLKVVEQKMLECEAYQVLVDGSTFGELE